MSYEIFAVIKRLRTQNESKTCSNLGLEGIKERVQNVRLEPLGPLRVTFLAQQGHKMRHEGQKWTSRPEKDIKHMKINAE